MYGDSRQSRPSGFTLIELLIVVAIIGLLSSIVFASLNGTREDAYEARSEAEFRTFRQAVALYREDNGDYPPDAERGVPPGLEPYLSTGSWPEAPWPDSVYDWDVWEIDGDQVVQLSVRFCEIDKPSTCNFPDEDWAENFDTYSAAYYCIEGDCRAHESKPEDHPGYCINCNP